MAAVISEEKSIYYFEIKDKVMNEKIVKLGTPDDALTLRNALSEHELAEFKSLKGHPATIAYLLFDSEAEILDRMNVDDETVPVFANVFDICDSLTHGFGQKNHIATVMEGRDKEITCRRLNETRLVLVRGKSNRSIGG